MHRIPRTPPFWLAICAVLALSAPARAGRPPTADQVDNAIDDKVNEAVNKLKAETVPRAAYLEDRKMLLESLEKSEPLAALLSGTIGFGAGSFYSDNPSMGWIFLSTEVGILALAEVSDQVVGVQVVQAEAILFLAVRVADLIMGTLDAGSYNEELIRRAQIGEAKMADLSPLRTPNTPPSGAGVSLLTLHF